MLDWAGFIVSALAVLYAGTGLSRNADIIATRLGLGRTWVGFVLLAAVTSLPELLTGVSAAASGLPNIAVGGVLGSCAFNLLILVLLDVLCSSGGRGGWVPSRAAAKGHLVAAGLGVFLLGIAAGGILFGTWLPAIGWVGPYSLVFVATYLVAMRIIYRMRGSLSLEVSEPGMGGNTHGEVTSARAIWRFAQSALLIVVAAVMLPVFGEAIAASSGLGNTFVGNVFVAVATSLPEIVISVTALRIGAVDMAIGNIFGSNVFNILILAVNDLAYRGGPILSAAEPANLVPALAALAMSAVAVLGLVQRRARGSREALDAHEVCSTRGRFVSWDSMLIVSIFIVNLVVLYLLR